MVKYVDHMFFSLIYILCFKLSEFFLPSSIASSHNACIYVNKNIRDLETGFPTFSGP